MSDPFVCAHCGFQPRPAAAFCAACGRSLQRPGPASAAAPTSRWLLRLGLLLGLALIVSLAAWGALARLGSTTTSTAQPIAMTATRTPTMTVSQTPRSTPGPTLTPLARATTAQPSAQTGQLRVHFIDVGQGDSILIQTPDGATALIDGGYNNGQALAYLKSQRIARIDVLIASHPHADHIGGLVEVLEALPVGQVWTSGATHTTGVFEQFLDAIDRSRAPYYEARTGQTIPLGELSLAVLRSDPHAADLNDTSLVLRLQYGAVSFLFTGDAEQPSEAELLRTSKAQLAATVLKVGHHGSYTSSSPAFLAAVAPEVAVYSAGVDNSYGHPHPETIQALEAVHARIYGTAEHGTVLIESDGQRYEVHPSRTPDPAATVPPAALEADRDCADFATHAEAQAFFIAAGGPARDPHRLDGDDDGVACERLP